MPYDPEESTVGSGESSDVLLSTHFHVFPQNPANCWVFSRTHLNFTFYDKARLESAGMTEKTKRRVAAAVAELMRAIDKAAAAHKKLRRLIATSRKRAKAPLVRSARNERIRQET